MLFVNNHSDDLRTDSKTGSGVPKRLSEFLNSKNEITVQPVYKYYHMYQNWIILSRQSAAYEILDI